MSPTSWTIWLNREVRREWGFKKAGEIARGEFRGEGDVRAWNRLSNGRRDGVGLRPYEDKRAPLLGEDALESYFNQ